MRSVWWCCLWFYRCRVCVSRVLVSKALIRDFNLEQKAQRCRASLACPLLGACLVHRSQYVDARDCQLHGTTPGHRLSQLFASVCGWVPCVWALTRAMPCSKAALCSKQTHFRQRAKLDTCTFFSEGFVRRVCTMAKNTSAVASQRVKYSHRPIFAPVSSGLPLRVHETSLVG